MSTANYRPGCASNTDFANDHDVFSYGTESSVGVVTAVANVATQGNGARHALYAAEEKTPALIIQNAAGKETAFSPYEWNGLPRKKVQKDPHGGVTSVYEGVLLSDLLRAAGVTLGKELRGPLLAAYVLAEAKDGLCVIYSIGEIDPVREMRKS